MATEHDTEDRALAYVQGELSADARRAFEDEMARDPTLHADVQGLLALQSILDDDARLGLETGDDEPPPHLLEAILRAEPHVRPPELRAAMREGKSDAQVARMDTRDDEPTLLSRLSSWIFGGGAAILVAGAFVFLVVSKDEASAPEAVMREASEAKPMSAPAAPVGDKDFEAAKGGAPEAPEEQAARDPSPADAESPERLERLLRKNEALADDVAQGSPGGGDQRQAFGAGGNAADDGFMGVTQRRAGEARTDADPEAKLRSQSISVPVDGAPISDAKLDALGAKSGGRAEYVIDPPGALVGSASSSTPKWAKDAPRAEPERDQEARAKELSTKLDAKKMPAKQAALDESDGDSLVEKSARAEKPSKVEKSKSKKAYSGRFDDDAEDAPAAESAFDESADRGFEEEPATRTAAPVVAPAEPMSGGGGASPSTASPAPPPPAKPTPTTKPTDEPQRARPKASSGFGTPSGSSSGPPALSTEEGAFLRKARERELESEKMEPSSSNKKGLDKAPLAKAKESKRQMEVESTFAAANNDFASGQYESALSLYVEAGGLDPGGKVLGALPVVGRMRTLNKLGRQTETLSLVPRLTATKGARPEEIAEGYLLAGDAAAALSRFAEAEAHYQRALKSPSAKARAQAAMSTLAEKKRAKAVDASAATEKK